MSIPESNDAIAPIESIPESAHAFTRTFNVQSTSDTCNRNGMKNKEWLDSSRTYKSITKANKRQRSSVSNSKDKVRCFDAAGAYDITHCYVLVGVSCLTKRVLFRNDRLYIHFDMVNVKCQMQ